MGFRIHETRGTDALERRISMRILVCPGVAILGYPFSADQLHVTNDRVVCVDPDHKRTYAPGLAASEMPEALEHVRRQARAWRPFAVTEAGRRYRYRIEIELLPSNESLPVLQVSGDGVGERVDDTSRPGRRHHTVAREKLERACDCVMVVHPNLGGLSPHAIVIEDWGDLHAPEWRDSPMSECSNFIRLDLQRSLAPADSLTAAHEIGHCLGLGHALPNTRHGVRIGLDALMFSQEGAPRALSEQDMVILHEVAQTFTARQGVTWLGAHQGRRERGRRQPTVRVVP